MSVTSGSFSAPLGPDLAKEIQSYVIGIPAGAGVAQTVNPTVAVQAVTLFNYTNNLLRATVTFSAGIVAAGAAATRTFLVPAGATYTIDFSAHGNDNVVGAVDAIDSLSVIAVVSGAATAEASTLTAATAAVAGVAYANFISA
jgi:hypothetical protein